MKLPLNTTLLAATVLLGAALPASAHERHNFIVQDLSTKPAFTQNTSQDLLLRSDNRGDTYLYVEQQQGTVLAVFDVTDPEHMKFVASIATEAHKAYDFVTPIGTSAELVAFRDGFGTAILDLRKAKAPSLSAAEGVAAKPTQILGGAGYLASSVPQLQATAPQPREIQLVETTRSPRLLSTFPSVTKQVDRPETGTVFLLSQGKVQVIRSLDAERQYDMDQVIKRDLN
ncbi:MAG TPA: hypothetical protein VNW54_09560 [Granulicella sp.]|jgi:hypothetical protein|nr:hypothetical protein [Granulicella sp.]